MRSSFTDQPLAFSSFCQQFLPAVFASGFRQQFLSANLVSKFCQQGLAPRI